MTIHITVVPASTQAGTEVIRVLLQSERKPLIRGIYRDLSKVPTEFTQQPSFEAVKGDVGTGVGLDFSNSNAVFYIPPPTYDGSGQGEFATRAARNVEDALRSAQTVKRLVLHSAMSAQYDHSIGVIRLNHISDRLLKSAAPEVLIVRPAFYYETFASALKTMVPERPTFESPISPASYEFPMVSVQDVGRYCANALLDVSTWPSFRCVNLFGPRLYSPIDVKNAVEAVTGKKCQLITIEREGLADYFAQHVPQSHVQEFVDMIVALLPGGIAAGDFGYGEDTIRGTAELVDAVRCMLSH
ncbi:hypothetical protein F5Y04DRAFT_271024 [Hypomontagnella monticulosa]|nr:hypothetical protein F5Y04DRAFT_271024 [Hypomontagnella monticulosa]